MAEKQNFHPALTVNNIRNFIPITLEMETSHYSSWAELFKIHCTVYEDNKASRAVHLENQFTRVHMDNYPNVSAYCQELKMLADQLSNVGAHVSEQRLVLQLIASLNENYDGVAVFIQQTNTACTALLTTNRSNDDNSGHSGSIQGSGNTAANRNTHNQRERGRGQNRNNNRGRNGGGRGRGRGNNSHNSGQQYNPRQWQQPYQWTPYSQWGPWGPQAWAVPPCPYPTSNWARPPSNRSPKTTGSRPPQAYSAHVRPPSNYAPTDIDATLQNLSLNVPDENWYMDTGTTSHMTTSQDGDATNEM
ncbi:unnamed protein product [Trifolium pratense]|uniref:Uncharacterized protein n=1 Tax=Trifolium pratense TaxID=57577 RepID=A0ACB0MGG6_TRIPR|nr:unnamed protein product [Trifolium pratense]